MYKHEYTSSRYTRYKKTLFWDNTVFLYLVSCISTSPSLVHSLHRQSSQWGELGCLLQFFPSPVQLCLQCCLRWPNGPPQAVMLLLLCYWDSALGITDSTTTCPQNWSWSLLLFVPVAKRTRQQSTFCRGAQTKHEFIKKLTAGLQERQTVCF